MFTKLNCSSCTAFVCDTTNKFGGYINTVLQSKCAKEKIPCVLINKENAQQYISSFAHDGDILFMICTDDGDAPQLLSTAKKLNMSTVLLSEKESKRASCLADISAVYRNDRECFELCMNFTEAFGNKGEATVKEGKLKKCGVSVNAFFTSPTEEMFGELKANDIKYIEISFGKYENTLNIDFKEYKRLADKYGIVLWSYHLPFSPFTTLNPAHFDETVRKFTIGYFKELMKEAKRDAGINLFVIHPSGEPIHEGDRKKAMEKAKKSLAELCDFADQNGMVLAVEDLPRTCLGQSSRDMLELLSCHKSLKMCFDLNHISGEDADAIIRRFKDKIVTLHVSDFLGKDECHLMPGEGNIDWAAVINEFNSAGYDGPFLYEISPGTQEDGEIWAKEAWHTKLFTRPRRLTLCDIKENFDKLNLL